MTLISSDLIRGALIDEMKASSSILAFLTDNDEIREANWKGSDFSYPNYRVRIDTNTPVDSCYQEFSGSILCFSTEASSKQAEEMAGAVANHFHGKAFTRNSVRFSTISVDIFPSISQDELTWRSEVRVRSIINGA